MSKAFGQHNQEQQDYVDGLRDINAELLEALECEQAMDEPFYTGKHILIKYGYDYENRFEKTASEFVAEKTKTAIAKTRAS